MNKANFPFISFKMLILTIATTFLYLSLPVNNAFSQRDLSQKNKVNFIDKTYQIINIKNISSAKELKKRLDNGEDALNIPNDNSVNISIYCADNLLAPNYIGTLGMYFQLQGCNRIEFRLRENGILKSLYAMNFGDIAKGISTTFEWLRPTCDKDIGPQHINLESIKVDNYAIGQSPIGMAQIDDNVFPTVRFMLPIADIIRTHGQLLSCYLHKIFSPRPYPALWQGTFDSIPSKAKIFSNKKEICKPTKCVCKIKFSSLFEVKRVKIFKAGYTNEHYLLKAHSPSFIEFKLKPTKKVQTPAPKK